MAWKWSTAVLAAVASPAAAQLSGWTDKQINATICTWSQPRAALIRDTVYLDGGNLRWSPGLNDGSFGGVRPELDLDQYVLTFNLSWPIKKDTNTSAILIDDMKEKPGDGQKPFFVDGGMLYNDAQAFLFGGAVFGFDEIYEAPAADRAYVYQAYEFGPDKPNWKQGFQFPKMGDDVNRYVAYGGAASAPSENKAWYFSGLTSPTNGEINTLANENNTNFAQKVSDRLITVDMNTQNDEKWTNTTIGDDIDGRANPEVVWVPVGKEGILVVLGGVTYPHWAGTEKILNSDDPEASKNESTEFMKVIDVYDIAGDEWYKQPTVDGPGARTRGCAVVAVASDQSSYNIYYYGGFDGINFDEPFSDEVWVLSLPSFTWTKINEGTELHARSGHKCFKPYDDQMMVFGGYTMEAGSSIGCLDGGPIIMFNLSSGEWMDEYHPEKFDEYAVPSKVQDKIGGDGAGGATLARPSPSGWATRALGEVFEESYDFDKITTYGPFNATETGRPNLPGDDDDDDDSGGGGGLPSWVAPVIGVIIGLIVVITAIVLFCLWKRRGIFKNRSNASGTEDPGMRIMSWMRGQQPNEKAVTLTSSEEGPASPDMAQVHGMGRTHGMASTATGTVTATSTPGLEYPPNRYEVEDTQLAELHDTSPPPAPVELPDSPLSHNDVLLKHSHLGKGDKGDKSSFSSPSSFSFVAGNEYASTISRSSAAANSSMPLAANRDTPPGGGSTPDPAASRVTSGVSGLSDADMAHLRHVSETSIDANLASTAVTPPASSPPPVVARRRPGLVVTRGDSTTLPEETPISPPTAGDSASDDYANARQALVSPLRRSVFRESEEDMKRDG